MVVGDGRPCTFLPVKIILFPITVAVNLLRNITEIIGNLERFHKFI